MKVWLTAFFIGCRYARSKSGQAAPQAGDLIAVSAPQTVTAKNQRLEPLINAVYQP